MEARRIPLPKRKRTKRQRSDQSPSTFPMTASDHDQEKVSKIDTFSPSGTYDSGESSELTRGVDDASEEEDMAHCLILLARGRFHERDHDIEEDEEEGVGEAYNHRISRFNSKRFLETGEYVFQCQTCDKVFPSFQALGGHRASHKKSKIASITNNPAKTAALDSTIVKGQMISTNDENALSLRLTTNAGKSSNLPKIHECSICGAEFSSGQALGGHMRRHRALLTGPLTTTAAMALTPKTPESEEPSRPPRCNKVPSFQLDLNLPAPEDDESESGFQMGSRGQDGSSLVFSFPPLVGCHY